MFTKKEEEYIDWLISNYNNMCGFYLDTTNSIEFKINSGISKIMFKDENKRNEIIDIFVLKLTVNEKITVFKKLASKTNKEFQADLIEVLEEYRKLSDIRNIVAHGSLALTERNIKLRDKKRIPIYKGTQQPVFIDIKELQNHQNSKLKLIKKLDSLLTILDDYLF